MSGIDRTDSGKTEVGIMRLSGHVAVITGGARGIGGATAAEFAREGAKVVIGDVLEAEAQATVASIRGEGGEALYVSTDVTSEAACARLMATARETYGRLDSLVCCAGIIRGSMVPVEEMEQALFTGVLDVNLVGSFLSVKHAVPHMRASGGGVVLLIASGAGVRGPSSSFAYGASKGGVHGLAMTLEPRLEPQGIRVHAICPAAIDTDMMRTSLAARATALGQPVDQALTGINLGDPRGVARVLAFLASADAAFVRGTVYTR